MIVTILAVVMVVVALTALCTECAQRRRSGPDATKGRQQ